MVGLPGGGALIWRITPHKGLFWKYISYQNSQPYRSVYDLDLAKDSVAWFVLPQNRTEIRAWNGPPGNPMQPSPFTRRHLTNFWRDREWAQKKS